MMAVPAAPVRTLADLAGRRSVVLGLARSGVAAARFLVDAGASVHAYDRRSADELRAAIDELGGRPIELALGVDELRATALLARADLIVTSPSVSPRFPTTDPWLRAALADAEARGTEIVSEVGLFLRLTAARVVAVTGTKGKTTTSTLLAAMLEAAGMPHELGGNIGRPLIEEAPRLGPEETVVLELSELQLPTIDRGADVAVYTNVAADHLDRHASVEAYRAVKARLAELTDAAGGSVVLNADDAGCRDVAALLRRGEPHWYGHEDPSRDATTSRAMIVLDGERLLDVADVPLPGRHMLSNVLAASLGARLAGVPPPAIAEAIRGFRGVPHRLESVGERNAVLWVNDSQATIPLAAIAALRSWSAPVVLIAGGKDKGLDYGELADEIAARCRAVVLMGETADEIERLLDGRTAVRRASSMDEAVVDAAGVARRGDVVLLAPAAASFDMFADYAARGDAFRAAAERIGVRREATS